MDDKKKEILIEDYKSSYNFSMSFSSMRMTAYSVAVAVMGLIGSFPANRSFAASLVASVLLTVTAVISTRVLIALNQGTFLFMVHCMGLEERLEFAGFPSTYLQYLDNKQRKRRNTGTFAFWLAAVLLNLAALGCMLLLVWCQPSVAPAANSAPVDVPRTPENWAAVAVTVLCGGALVWTLWDLYREPSWKYATLFQGEFRDAQNRVMAKYRRTEEPPDGDEAAGTAV